MGKWKRGIVAVAAFVSAALIRALARHGDEIFGSGQGLAIGLAIVAFLGLLAFVGTLGHRRVSAHLENLTPELGWLPGEGRRWLSLSDDTLIREWEGKRVGLSYWEANASDPESVRISVEAPFPGAVSLVRRSRAEAPAPFGLGPRPTVESLTRIFRAEGDLALLDRLVTYPETVSLIEELLSLPGDELILERGRLRLKASLVTAKSLPAPPPRSLSTEPRQPIDAFVLAMWDAVKRLYRMYSPEQSQFPRAARSLARRR